jgi:hypothetical protein
LAVIVPAPLTLPARTSTSPPPAPPLEAMAESLLRVPAPPPPPRIVREALAVKENPPNPPRARFEDQVFPP